MATENPSAPLPFTTLIHMITVKLSSANDLIWHSQILPFIESQDLVGHIDGSIAHIQNLILSTLKHQVTNICLGKKLINPCFASSDPP